MNHLSQPRRRGSRLLARLTGTVAAAVAVSLGVGVGPVAAAVPVPAPVTTYTTAPEAYARYAGQVVCTSTAQPGTLAFAALIRTTYVASGTQTIGTTRSCSSGGKSEHKDGRALDWMLDVDDTEDRALANGFLSWLIGPDAQGVTAGNARRLGVMYIIWNKHSWNAYDTTPGWVPYTGANPHTDHIHISLSWDGALKRTSFWTGVATTRYDYGPCQIWVGEAAEPGPHYDRCPAPRYRPGQAFPRRWDADVAADVLASATDGRLLLYPGTGSGAFGRMRQVGNGWTTMNSVTAVGDLDGDGRRDLVARSATGDLYLYRGNGTGGFSGSRKIGNGWNGMDTIVGAGDIDQDGSVDLVSRRAADGAVLLYRGNGAGGLASAGVVASAADADLLQAVGDVSGDGIPDLVARVAATGALELLPGDGRGGFLQRRAIGTGWSPMLAVLGPGDFDGGGRADLLAVGANGDLLLYAGRGDGSFAAGRKIGNGWSSLSLVD